MGNSHFTQKKKKKKNGMKDIWNKLLRGICGSRRDKGTEESRNDTREASELVLFTSYWGDYIQVGLPIW